MGNSKACPSPLSLSMSVATIQAEVKSGSQAFDPEHPLLKDRRRLDAITNIMFVEIQKALFPGSPVQRRPSGTGHGSPSGQTELVLVGTGLGAEDVLSEAVAGLLQHPPDRLRGSWEGLGVTIAGNKARDALRARAKGLRGTDYRPPLRLVTGDHERPGPGGETEPPLFESIPSNSDDPEARYLVLESVLKLLDLARQHLNDRERGVFLAIHFGRESRKELGERLDLTRQRIGQVYDAACRTLEARPRLSLQAAQGHWVYTHQEERMSMEHDDLRRFRDSYLDYLEGDRDEPPALEDLPEGKRPAAEAFIRSITAARGIDPYASRPSIEQLLARQPQTDDHTAEFTEVLQNHLRLTVDPKASVTADAAAFAAGLASASVAQVRGMRIRVVPETDSTDLEEALAGRAEDIVRVFGAFPDSHAVLYITTGRECLGVIVDRADVYYAIETPSGQRQKPRLRREITHAPTACAEWLTSRIPEFSPVRVDALEHAFTRESALDAGHLASTVVNEITESGSRAKIEAKRATWQGFGLRETQCLVAMVQVAQQGQLSREDYESRLDDLVGTAA